jgi:tetratricopeptide (TPR) repeat protein
MTGMHPNISLCMIVRDEASVLEQALSSVLPIVSEIIVVDTGSIDSSKDVALKFGATIIDFAWTGDFAEARNISLAAARGDWILVLDADEAIDSEQHQELIRLTSDNNKCYELIQRHYSNDHRLSDYQVCTKQYPQWERHYTGFFESKLVRLFPNNRGISYVGRIHELVEPSISTLPELTIVSSSIRLHHYGHTPEITAKKNKHSLYKDLGSVKASEAPTDWKAFFELGVECNRPERREESVEAFKRSLELNPTYVPSWINLGYVLCELQRTTEAIECLTSAIKLEPNSAEARCNLGVALLREGKARAAEQQFREAIRLKPTYVNAIMNLARALGLQNRFPEAILIAERCFELSPGSASVQAELGLLYAAGGAEGLGRGFLVSALQIDPSLEDARRVLENLDRNASHGA